jgi:hypothetical protein
MRRKTHSDSRSHFPWSFTARRTKKRAAATVPTAHGISLTDVWSGNKEKGSSGYRNTGMR